MIVGIAYDEYNPNVEGQIVKDFLALKMYYDDLQAVCDSPYIVQRPLQALGVSVCDSTDSADTYLAYRSISDEYPETPESVEDIIYRDLYLSKSDNFLTTEPVNNPYLKEQGRPYISNMTKLQYNNNRRGFIDPAIILLWGK